MTEAYARRILRVVLLEREKRRCFYCSRPVRIYRAAGLRGRKTPPDHATIDHIIPESQGGPTDSANCVCACRKCNSERGSTDAKVFLARKQWLLFGIRVSPETPEVEDSFT